MRTPKAYRQPKLQEKHVQQQVTDFLQYDGWRAFRMEHAVEFDIATRRFKRRVGEVGMPDYLYLRYSKAFDEVLWIEFKAKGEKPDPHQELWHAGERARGAQLIVVDNFDEFLEWYEIQGLQKNRTAKLTS